MNIGDAATHSKPALMVTLPRSPRSCQMIHSSDARNTTPQLRNNDPQKRPYAGSLEAGRERPAADETGYRSKDPSHAFAAIVSPTKPIRTLPGRHPDRGASKRKQRPV